VVLAVGFAQVATAIPNTPGLYIVDTTTGQNAYVPIGAGGVAVFVGTVGDYSVNLGLNASGLTLLGGVDPCLDLQVASAIPGPGATTLKVFYSDGTFAPGGTGFFNLATTAGPINGSVTSSAYTDSTIFGTTTLLASSADTGVYTVNGTGALNPGSTYYVTLEDVIAGTASSMNTTFNTVPDGATTALLLGLGLSGVAALRKKFAV